TSTQVLDLATSPLTAPQPTQLTDYPSRLVSLRTDTPQTAVFTRFHTKLNPRTTPRHIRRNRYLSRTACFCYDIGLFLVKLSVQYIMLDAAQLQHTAQ